MIASLSIPRGTRHPAWFVPVLLPTLPFLGWIFGARGSLAPAQIGAGLLLLALGLALATALPSLLEFLGPEYRNEAEHLRDPWLAATFLAQIPSFVPGAEWTFPSLAFATTSALIAAIPFGSEFQQRTIASLLSQPVERHAWWTLKTQVLAAAMSLHTLAYLLGRLAMGYPITPIVVLSTVVIAATAFATTPCGTIAARSLLIGLAFSLALPLLVGFTGFLLIQWLARLDEGGLWVLAWDYETIERAGFNLLLFGLAPVYALIGHRLGRRAWLALEAPDPSDTGPAPLWKRSDAVVSSSASSAHRHSRASWQIRKELRLQSVTLVAACLCLILAVVITALDNAPIARDMASTTLWLVAGATILLAGGVPVAEERRLGTLESHVALPRSRRSQWWLKTLVAAAIAVAVTLITGFALIAPHAINPAARLQVTVAAVFTAFALFGLASLASSGSPNTLRAILASVGVIIPIAVLGTIVVSLTTDYISEVQSGIRASAESHPEPWLRDAEAAANEPSRLQAPSALLVTLPLALLLPAPVLLALYYARRNFQCPADAPRFLPGQFIRCGFLAAVGLFVSAAAEVGFERRLAHVEMVQSAKSYADVHRTFSATERQLWSQYHRGTFNTDIYVEVEPFPTESSLRTRILHLPLSFPDRRLLIHRGQISEPLKEGLRREGRMRGEDVETPPPVPPARRLFDPMRPVYRHDEAGNVMLMDQSLRAKYGLNRREGTVKSPNPDPQPPHR